MATTAVKGTEVTPLIAHPLVITAPLWTIAIPADTLLPLMTPPTTTCIQLTPTIFQKTTIFVMANRQGQSLRHQCHILMMSQLCLCHLMEEVHSMTAVKVMSMEVQWNSLTKMLKVCACYNLRGS